MYHSPLFFKRGVSKAASLCALLLGAAVMVGSAGCAGHAATSARRPAGLAVHPVPGVCSVGRLKLSAVPAYVSPGEMVTLKANGSRRGGAITTTSYGTFGTTKGGHFAATYYLAAITPPYKHAPPNIRITAARQLLAGTSMANKTFRVKVPHVRADNYIVQFAYSVAVSTGSGVSGLEPGTYTLCVRLHVR
jgi:hypothetical protein